MRIDRRTRPPGVSLDVRDGRQRRPTSIDTLRLRHANSSGRVPHTECVRRAPPRAWSGPEPVSYPPVERIRAEALPHLGESPTKFRSLGTFPRSHRISTRCVPRGPSRARMNEPLLRGAGPSASCSSAQPVSVDAVLDAARNAGADFPRSRTTPAPTASPDRPCRRGRADG